MSTDPVVALLAKQSGARLREMQAEISAQIRSLQVQADLVERAIAEKGSGSTTEHVRKSTPRATGPSGRNTRARFIEILSTPHHGAWKPAEIRDQLAERGVDSSTASIRVMLRRLLDRGEVVRVPDGWKLASTNGSHQESLVEALEPGTRGV